MEFVTLFLLGFSSLIPLVNPIGTALIVNPVFAPFGIQERKALSRDVVFACFGLGIATLFAGSWCLKFMGVSIATTQMGGGIIIARFGLSMLSSQKQESSSLISGDVRSGLFYPIAFPITVGPGVIAVLITLSAHAHKGDFTEILIRLSTVGASLLVVLTVTYFCLVYSGKVIARIGETGSLVLNRLMAFLVFCIGIQMVVTGLGRSFPHLFLG
jgi:multiple antibiotic resistance protein